MPPRNQELFNAQTQPIHWCHNIDTTATTHCQCGFIRQPCDVCHLHHHHTHAPLHAVDGRLTAAASTYGPLTLCCEPTLPARHKAATQQAALAHCGCCGASAMLQSMHSRSCHGMHQHSTARLQAARMGQQVEQQQQHLPIRTSANKFFKQTSHVVKPWRNLWRLTAICCVPSPNPTLL